MLGKQALCSCAAIVACLAQVWALPQYDEAPGQHRHHWHGGFGDARPTDAAQTENIIETTTVQFATTVTQIQTVTVTAAAACTAASDTAAGGSQPSPPAAITTLVLGSDTVVIAQTRPPQPPPTPLTTTGLSAPPTAASVSNSPRSSGFQGSSFFSSITAPLATGISEATPATAASTSTTELSATATTASTTAPSVTAAPPSSSSLATVSSAPSGSSTSVSAAPDLASAGLSTATTPGPATQSSLSVNTSTLSFGSAATFGIVARTAPTQRLPAGPLPPIL